MSRAPDVDGDKYVAPFAAQSRHSHQKQQDKVKNPLEDYLNSKRPIDHQISAKELMEYTMEQRHQIDDINVCWPHWVGFELILYGNLFIHLSLPI